MGNYNYKRNKKHGKPKPRTETYNPPYDAGVLAMSIEGLNLSPHTLTALKNARLLTVKDLVVRTSFDMYKIQNFGKKNLIEVQSKLSILGVDFKPAPNSPKPEVNESTAPQPTPSKNQQKNETGKNPQPQNTAKDKTQKQEGHGKQKKETPEDKNQPKPEKGKSTRLNKNKPKTIPTTAKDFSPKDLSCLLLPSPKKRIDLSNSKGRENGALRTKKEKRLFLPFTTKFLLSKTTTLA